MNWTRRSLVVGMPHMIPDQLAEVELLKVLGDAQWQCISSVLDVPSFRICNDSGERLYASFINIDLSFGQKTPLHFGEGTVIHIRHALRLYARRFVEGFICFDDRDVPDSLLGSIESRDDLRRLPYAWCYLTNAFVAREESNSRLRTFAPAGTNYGTQVATEVKPPGIIEHELVEASGELALPGMDAATRLDARTAGDLVYPILPESDLNGAGLLYFARYVAICNYGERRFLRECSTVDISSRLIHWLTPTRRKLCFFGNANEHDSISVAVHPLVCSGTQECAPVNFTAVLKMYFMTALRRVSDGVLIAQAVSEKQLVIPNGFKSVMLEARRLARAVGIDTPI